MLSLLEAIGTTVEEHNGKVKVTVGTETETFVRPHGKDIGEPMLVDLRRMLAQAGLSPTAPARADTRTRDHGDSRRGEPD